MTAPDQPALGTAVKTIPRGEEHQASGLAINGLLLSHEAKRLAA